MVKKASAVIRPRRGCAAATACKPVLAPAGNVESSLGKRRKGEKYSAVKTKSDIVVSILLCEIIFPQQRLKNHCLSHRQNPRSSLRRLWALQSVDHVEDL
jgi:hypothetical protein